jgi:hypothetical protein
LNENRTIEEEVSNVLNQSKYQGTKVKEYEIEDNKNEILVPLDFGELPDWIQNLIENDTNYFPEIKS